MLDLVLEGGTLIDGSGAPPRRADVGVAGGQVAAVGDLAAAARGRTVGCAGLAVAPGFIDCHSHSDVSCLLHPQGRSSLLQGITTEVVGNCGYSLAPAWPGTREAMFDRLLGRCVGPGSAERVDWSWRSFPEFMEMLARRGTGTNKALLVGQGTIRACVMGSRRGPASPAELDTMRGLLAEAMEAGAVGMSTGREYRPGCYAGLDEVVELARDLGRFGGLYVSHMANESDGVADSVEEVLEIGRRSGQRVQVSHHNVVGRRNRGRLTQTVRRIEAARAGGIDVALDFLHFHPYYHPHRLDELLPPELSELPNEEQRRRLRQPEVRAQVRQAFAGGWVSNLELTYPGAEWDYNLLEAPGLAVEAHASVAELAEQAAAEPLELALDLIVRASGPVIVSRVIAPEDVQAVLRSPLVMLGTDTYALDRPLEPTMALHPRNYGAFPHFLGHHVRERGLMPLHEAVWRMTGYPAERFRLRHRGRLAAGYAADVVVFDPGTVAGLATLRDPYRPPAGIARVLVNGREVVTDGAATDERPGAILRRG